MWQQRCEPCTDDEKGTRGIKTQALSRTSARRCEAKDRSFVPGQKTLWMFDLIEEWAQLVTSPRQLHVGIYWTEEIVKQQP